MVTGVLHRRLAGGLGDAGGGMMAAEGVEDVSDVCGCLSPELSEEGDLCVVISHVFEHVGHVCRSAGDEGQVQDVDEHGGVGVEEYVGVFAFVVDEPQQGCAAGGGGSSRLRTWGSEAGPNRSASTASARFSRQGRWWCGLRGSARSSLGRHGGRSRR